MTTTQVVALEYGFLGFLAIWLTVLIPQIITHHARYGRVNPRRILTTAAIILYSCLVLAIVFLPLPGPNTSPLRQAMQLKPFQWLQDIQTELIRHDLSTSDLLSTTAFQQFAMNVLLFLPLGLIARTLWRRGIVGTAFIGLAASLTIEIAQLTANFGTAPQAYRIFDVDDLISNSSGAVLGWIAAALFLTLLQGRKLALRPQPVRSERIDFAQSR